MSLSTGRKSSRIYRVTSSLGISRSIRLSRRIRSWSRKVGRNQKEGESSLRGTRGKKRTYDFILF